MAKYRITASFFDGERLVTASPDAPAIVTVSDSLKPNPAWEKVADDAVQPPKPKPVLPQQSMAEMNGAKRKERN